MKAEAREQDTGAPDWCVRPGVAGTRGQGGREETRGGKAGMVGAVVEEGEK